MAPRMPVAQGQKKDVQGSCTPARSVAFDVLLRVEKGAWASDLLRSASEKLDARDAALAHQIVFGVLRRQLPIDAWIAARTNARKLDVEVRIALRMGLFQLRFLDRVPAYAVVSDSVNLVKRARKTSAAGLVNAVLKNKSPLPESSPADAIPRWIYSRWVEHFGEEAAQHIAQYSQSEPESAIEPATGRIQDVGAQWVITLLELEPGLSFLDTCAAPGNKTAQAIAAGTQVIACDRHLHRLAAMRDLGCSLVQMDATCPFPFQQRFDRVLVDAPCSGTGTLARNPEIRYRLKPEDLVDLHARQVRILKNAIDCVAPGGILVYSTCSLEREENEEVVREVLGRIPEETHYRLPGVQPGDGFYAAVLRF
ncbi:MAG: transcription antitermination factor NusB [Bryobacteraceae bacterium]